MSKNYCCCDLSGLMPELVGLGLAPAIPAGACSGVNPERQETLNGTTARCTRGVPCCGSVTLASFLAPFGGSLPIALGAATFIVPGASPTPFVGVANPLVITTPGELVTYLNGQLASAIGSGYTVEGAGAVFSTDGINLQVPRIGGSCSAALQDNTLTLRGAPSVRTMLVYSQEAVAKGMVIAAVGFNLPDPGGFAPGRGRLRSIIANDPPSEVIATKAMAVAVKSGEEPPHVGDSWAMVIDVQRNVLPGFDRAFVRTVGQHFLLSELDGSPLQETWARIREPGVASPVGAFLGPVAGFPVNGHAARLPNAGELFPPGSAVISPRIAMPVDITDPKSGKTQPGFILQAADPRLAVVVLEPAPVPLAPTQPPVLTPPTVDPTLAARPVAPEGPAPATPTPAPPPSSSGRRGG